MLKSIHNLLATVLALSLLLVVSSCGNKNIYKVILPQATEIEAKIKTIDKELLAPGRTFITDDKLVVYEQPLSTEMFKVFSLPSLDYLYSYGVKGRGPKEYVSLGNESIISTSGQYVELYDVGMINYVQFGDTMAAKVNQRPIDLSLLRSPVNRLKKLDHENYYFDNFFENDQEEEFTGLNISSNVLSYFGKYPKWNRNLTSAEDKYSAYLKATTYSSAHDRIAAFYFHFPVLKLLDGKGNFIKEIHLEDQAPMPKYEHEGDRVMYFVEPSSTDNYIYVMWIGRSKSAIGKDVENYRPEIMVFNWDGEIVARFKLDKPVVTLSVSEKYNKIYATSFIDPKVLYEFDLPAFGGGQEISLTEVGNSFFTVSILEGYTLSMSSQEDGADKVIERDGYRINKNYYADTRNLNGKEEYDLESIEVGVYEPLDKTKTSSYRDFIRINSSSEIVMQSDIVVDSVDVLQTITRLDYLDPKGVESVLYSCEYIFGNGDKIAKISVSSKSNNFSEFNQSFIKSITSFKFLN